MTIQAMTIQAMTIYLVVGVVVAEAPYHRQKLRKLRACDDTAAIDVDEPGRDQTANRHSHSSMGIGYY